MKTFHSVLASILLCICSCQKPSNPLQEYIVNYFQQYPEATLQDIYKGSFQDIFGPAHILTNREAVKNYIQQEMEHAKAWEEKDYIPCGWQGNFYQVNLKVIADGRVPMNEFVDAFMSSAKGIDTTLTQKFIDDWMLIQQSIKTIKPDLKGFAEDSAILSTLLNEGKYVVHHSEKFNNHYQPHYRIIRKDIFKEKILPYLK